ncbi:MAG: sirohydrochlorin chelatase [cyanobacterium endosymbiont of Rhopalodia musculus]|uniref:sirohydrochlorin chelatase n=1 Tax=cyanobacterium endosymbiont of Epithemia clementina EcSB TaxID=3034674 RepID=UPI0024814151|nr:sirohydrochlorin chelatase [cyanobacterium endosymbiont of Epithemia clementina EcSB]WGT68370.1 sirohydrochlorin chelatase [cyanobacterium endosymbiont of Epithemia clementina EcSB]
MIARALTFPEILDKFSPLPFRRPLLIIGHGTRDIDGKQTFLNFVNTYQTLDTSRPVIPCFLELTEPLIQEGIDRCVTEGFREMTALPFLLFAARHTKFDVTNALDQAKKRYPFLRFHYGRHFGNTPLLLDVWRSRLAKLDKETIAPEDTVLLIVGRGSSDPDANSEMCKFSRLLWEGSHYRTVETCFIGITHPRLEEGFERARLYNPKRIIVLPHFLFTGALVKKIFYICAQQQEQYPDIEILSFPEIGLTPELFLIIREREIESQLGQTQMNCEMCKFRLTPIEHDHFHDHHHLPQNSYDDVMQYHEKIWQVP